MSKLSVDSEIGRLRSVMVHLPGLEIDRMLPSMMDELLFDDILFGEHARAEHRRFQRLLDMVADEVLELSHLLAEVVADEAARQGLLSDLAGLLHVSPAAMEVLRQDTPAELARHLVEGVLRPGVDGLPENVQDLFLLPPIPNFFFQRDPAVVVGDRVVVASMATPARVREALLSRYVFTHHPRFAEGGSPVLFSVFDDGRGLTGSARAQPTLEGGDVLVPTADTLIIGVSIRTSRKAVHELAIRLKQHESPIRRILLVEIPQKRSFMHLDTVFTLISEGECLLYEPAILPGGVEELDVYQVNLSSREVTYTSKPSLLDALAASGLELRPIPCGGGDSIAAHREQWTDGANAFALAPGVLLCYERNVRTTEALSQAGYRVVSEDDLLLGREELSLDRTVILTAGHELSRARGGPRCMTMPLARDPI